MISKMCAERRLRRRLENTRASLESVSQGADGDGGCFKIPTHLLVHALSFLEPVSGVAAVTRVSRSWARAANQPQLWRTLNLSKIRLTKRLTLTIVAKLLRSPRCAQLTTFVWDHNRCYYLERDRKFDVNEVWLALAECLSNATRAHAEGVSPLRTLKIKMDADAPMCASPIPENLLLLVLAFGGSLRKLELTRHVDSFPVTEQLLRAVALHCRSLEHLTITSALGLASDRARLPVFKQEVLRSVIHACAQLDPMDANRLLFCTDVL